DDQSKGDGLSKGVALLQGLWFVTQCLARTVQHLPATELEVATVAFAVLNFFIKPLDVQDPIPIGSAVVPEFRPQVLNWKERFSGLLGIPYDYEPLSSNSVSSFFSMSSFDDTYASVAALYAEIIVGSVFDAIHCAASNASFPSSDEKWMWRSCAVLVTAIPLLMVLDAVVIISSITEAGTTVVFFLPISVYIVARLFLIVLPFAALRALPPGAFVDVDWNVYIPHL
ncbi:hypothetical protein GGX14DRAFT_379995, partial [Mycena pura]